MLKSKNCYQDFRSAGLADLAGLADPAYLADYLPW